MKIKKAKILCFTIALTETQGLSLYHIESPNTVHVHLDIVYVSVCSNVRLYPFRALVNLISVVTNQVLCYSKFKIFVGLSDIV